ncbi:AraC family transcriptional regulator [Niallia taxi]|uniref:AraC family transcriptional regulator n=1 Tax=Niallia taxi TaxID=2499688 RepID=UPI00203B532D|nr:AraC family transcriptional regulator [Niallia taxi]MCM3213761.1 AraC family transcriptional regulator [Niallia taxi]
MYFASESNTIEAGTYFSIKMITLTLKRWFLLEQWLLANYRMRGMEPAGFEFHSHREYEIYFFHSGDCKYLINNRIYELQPGDILLMDGLTLHKPNPSLNTPYVRSVVHFSPAYLQEILQALGMEILLAPFRKLNNCLLRTNYDCSAKLVEEKMSKIGSLFANNDKPSYCQADIQEAQVKLELVQLLVEIYKMSQNDLQLIPAKRTEKEIHAEMIAAWIDDHFTEKISLERLAKERNLSKYYTSHVFKEITGFTVMEYLMGCRLNHAKYLLEVEPQLTLTEIAHKSGFENISHFSRYFKEKVGNTAKKYRALKLEKKF